MPSGEWVENINTHHGHWMLLNHHHKPLTRQRNQGESWERRIFGSAEFCQPCTAVKSDRHISQAARFNSRHSTYWGLRKNHGSVVHKQQTRCAADWHLKTPFLHPKWWLTGKEGSSKKAPKMLFSKQCPWECWQDEIRIVHADIHECHKI